jgi:hypothetical protein
MKTVIRLGNSFASFDQGGMFSLAGGGADALEWAYPGGDYDFARASVGLVKNADGDWVDVAADTPRIDGDGYLILEKEATNQTRNSHAAGGTSGANPTNWTHFLGGGLSYSRVGLQTIDGIQCFVARLHGVANANNGLAFRWEGTGNQAAAAGDQVTTSVFMAMLAGSTANFTDMRMNILPYNAGAALAIQYGTNVFKTGLTGELQRFLFDASPSRNPYATMPANTTHYRGALEFAFLNGAAIDITLAWGLPQDEHGNKPSSPIRTTTVALTRAADLLTPNLPEGATQDMVFTHDSGTSTIEDVTAPYTIDAAALSRPRVSAINWAPL